MKDSRLSVFKSALASIAMTLACALTVSVGHAQIVNLSSGNSDASINFGSQAGMYAWNINGQSQLHQQWFWFRVNEDPSGQHSLDTLGAPQLSQNANTVSALYTGPGFTISLSYQLNGGQAGGSDWHSDILESISIQNTSGSVNTFHFFQYSDFGLAGTSGGESVNIFQNGGFFSKATVTKAANQVAETIDQPLANEAEADLTPGTLNRLNQGSPYTLNGTLNAGPDAIQDATWALQWDASLNPGDTVDILKDKKLSVAPVPEPGTFSLLMLGLVTVAWRRTRRSV